MEGGGLSRFITILQGGGAGGGALGTPNLYYVIYGRALYTVFQAGTPGIRIFPLMFLFFLEHEWNQIFACTL